MRINRFRLYLQSWFTFTRRERNGILLLTILLFILQAVLLSEYFIFPDDKGRSLTADEKAAVIKISRQSFTAGNVRDTIGTDEIAVKYNHVDDRATVEYFTENIDPNIQTQEQWIKYGLSPKQALAVINWCRHGGKFRSVDDVRSMKFISSRVFDKIQHNLVFNSVSQTNIRDRTNDERKQVLSSNAKFSYSENQLLDLNSADSVSLNALPFIGTGRANAIMRYRERLGGFYAVSQLSEIKMIPDSVYRIIEARVTIRSPVFRKMNVNTLKADSTWHPYLPKAFARLIENYRAEHGAYKSLGEIRNLPLADEELWRKLAPYLTITP